MRSLRLTAFLIFRPHVRSSSLLARETSFRMSWSMGPSFPLPSIKRRRACTLRVVEDEAKGDKASCNRSLDSEIWHDLCVPPEELRPASTLTIGQCFNWRKASADCWVGVIGREVIAISLRAVAKDKDGADNVAVAALSETLREYFFLKVPLAPLYRRWAEGDRRLAAVAGCIPGVRVVRQNPVECIFSFICSSNNNIPRITGMLEKLRGTYGDLLLSVGEGGLAATGALGNIKECEDWAKMPLELHSFPTVEALASRATETDLRAMGFGYRAKYIVNSAELMHSNGGERWALKLRHKERDEVRTHLTNLCGVGPKVADCIALFSLDQTSTIPVDVHVWRIACRDYDSSLLDCKSLTPTVYARVGNLFRDRFGEHAGWAHSLLFAAELPGFKAMLSEDMQREMDDFKREEKQAKAESRAKKPRVTDDKSSQRTKKARGVKKEPAVRPRGRTNR